MGSDDVKARIERATGVTGRAERPAARAAGAFRLAFEARAIAAMCRRAEAPEACGPEMPAAPARGLMLAFDPVETVRTDAGRYVVRKTGHMGRRAARVASAFDRMSAAARAAHARAAARAASRGLPEPRFAPPFTPAQEAAGLGYAALVERCAAFGVRCASTEAGVRGGAPGPGCEDAVVDALERLRLLRGRIGRGVALRVRRRAEGRRSIPDLRLVEAVCVGGLTLDAVLRRHGWAPNGQRREALRRALAGALDRMQG